MDTSGLEVAILEFPLPVRSYTIRFCPIRYLDLKNIDIAFKLVLPSFILAEIWVLPVLRPPLWIFHFGLSYSIPGNLIGLLNLENMEVAFEILLISRIGAEI